VTPGPPLSGSDPVVDVDRDTARSLAVEELARREYTEAQPNLLQRALLWLLDQVDRLLDGASGSGSVGALVIGLLVVVAVLLVAFLLAGPLRGLRAARSTPADVFGGTLRTAAEHRRDAAAAASDGRWSEAVQERFRALARGLEERVVLDVRPGRTALEVALEAGALLPSAAAAMREAAHVFDDVTYGERSGDEAGYRVVVRADEQAAAARPRHDDAVPVGLVAP
jgi:hypothetical protein